LFLVLYNNNSQSTGVSQACIVHLEQGEGHVLDGHIKQHPLSSFFHNLTIRMIRIMAMIRTMKAVTIASLSSTTLMM
jgi:hypothetical protein